MMHTLAGEMQLKPRTYGVEIEEQKEDKNEILEQDVMSMLDPNMKDDNLAGKPRSLQVDGNNIARENALQKEIGGRTQIVRRNTYGQIDHGERYVTDDAMQIAQRGSLNRFQPLQFNGTQITDVTIGGFAIDIQKTAEIIASFAPLPPVALPKIFMDQDLNFYHHFFQGIERLAGREFITRIMDRGSYSTSDKESVFQPIKELIISGCQDEDIEITVLVKRVLLSTFDTMPPSTNGAKNDQLMVGANLWGFPYIEPGMKCGDSDLKMWLHLSYSEYRTLWFNNFKSSGIPTFALDGVQARYEENSIRRMTLPKSKTETRYTEQGEQIRENERELKKTIEYTRHRKPRRYEQPPKQSALQRFLTSN